MGKRKYIPEFDKQWDSLYTKKNIETNIQSEIDMLISKICELEWTNVQDKHILKMT